MRFRPFFHQNSIRGGCPAVWMGKAISETLKEGALDIKPLSVQPSTTATSATTASRATSVATAQRLDALLRFPSPNPPTFREEPKIFKEVALRLDPQGLQGAARTLCRRSSPLFQRHRTCRNRQHHAYRACCCSQTDRTGYSP